MRNVFVRQSFTAYNRWSGAVFRIYPTGVACNANSCPHYSKITVSLFSKDTLFCCSGEAIALLSVYDSFTTFTYRVQEHQAFEDTRRTNSTPELQGLC